MTDMVDKKTPVDRLNYSGSLTPVIERLSTGYGIGELQGLTVIRVGYEDCNVIVQTKQGKFVAKIFEKGRTPRDISRYTKIMERAIQSGVNHPSLLKTSDGDVVYSDRQNGLSLVLMDFVDGQTFFELNRPPNPKELRAIIEQAAKVNKIDYKPPYISDSWAIPNIQPMFDKTKQFIKSEDMGMIEQAIAKYKAIPVDDLPHCFVHGDFTKANVLKGKNEKIYILDFSVANWYPRIQELSVISANLMYDKNSKVSLRERTEIVCREYKQFSELTDVEKKWLYDYALAGVAMEFLGSHQEKHINGNDTEETDYWMNLGREGLRAELKK